MSILNTQEVDTSLLKINDDRIYFNDPANSDLIKVKTIDDYFAIIEKCYDYTYNFEDLFFPPHETFIKLCTSSEKTYLFLISLVRCIFYLLVLKVYTDIFDTKEYWNSIIFMVLLAIVVINIFMLFVTMMKKPKISAYDLTPTYSLGGPPNMSDFYRSQTSQQKDFIYE